jgi:hypothetical protein
MICFLPSNKYHVETMARVIDFLSPEHKEDFIFVDLEDQKHEGSRAAIEALNLPSMVYSEEFFTTLPPGSAVVVMCDWSPWEQKAVIAARQSGIATIGMIEGCQDYLDTHIEHLKDSYSFKPRYPYATVAERLLLGEYDSNFINGVVTGCPRFDSLVSERPPLPEKPTVCINSNFTYSLYEDIRDKWCETAVAAAEKAGWDYYIIQHPRDRGDYSNYNTHENYDLHEALRKSHLLISRFSSIIFDALLLGRRVVYYNPHQERQPTFLEPNGAFDYVESGSNELKSVLEEIIAKPDLNSINSLQNDPAILAFLEHHLGPLDGKASQRCGEQISRIAKQYTNSGTRIWND